MLGAVVALAVAGVILVQPVASPAQAVQTNFTPDVYVNNTGGIPCLTASKAEFTRLGCRGRVLEPFDVPSELVAPIVTTGRDHFCSPTPLSPMSKTSTVQSGVSVSSSTSVTSERNGQKHWANGTTITVTRSKMPGGIGQSIAASYHHTTTYIDGWSESNSRALGSTFSMTDSRTAAIAPYHWMVWTFTPKFRQVEVLWTWNEPSIQAQRANVQSSGIETHRFPVFRAGYLPPKPSENGVATIPSDVLMGDWRSVHIPMTPAEIDACATPDGLKYPTFQQADLLGPSGTAYLDSMPYLVASTPPTTPVLRNQAGTPSKLESPALMVGYSWSGGPQFEPVSRSLQMTGGSQVDFWTAGGCSAFTARIGYGPNFLIARDGHARDTFQVVAGTLVNGIPHPEVDEDGNDRVLGEWVVPTTPDVQNIEGREHFQTSITADISGVEVLMLRVKTGDGYRDVLSNRVPGVIIAEPLITCRTDLATSALQTSAYVDPIVETTVNLASTPEQVAADPKRFMQPSEVNYGWGGCINDPKNPAGVMPRTTINSACGGAPLTIQGKVYETGIGFHSGESLKTGQSLPASVVWAKIPETCRVLSFGVAFDDHPYFPRATHKVAVYSQLHTPEDGGLNPWGQGREMIGSPLTLSGDGTSGVQWFHFEQLGLGAKRIEIEVSTDDKDGGHIDIVDPTLTCDFQGPATSVAPPAVPTGSAVGRYSVAQMEWASHWGGHGPVEIDQSNGEAERYDGRPLEAPNGGPVLAIGGVSGWSAAIGMAPSSKAESFVTVTTAARCERLTAWVGIDDYAGNNGAVTFKVYADGVLKESSGVKRGGELPSFLTADVTGALEVTLAVNALGSNVWDHADWADPILHCGSNPEQANIHRLGDRDWSSDSNGWGPVERNMSLGESAARDGRPMSIGGVSGWKTGLGVAPGHASASEVKYALDGSCQYFTTWVGVDDEVGANGSVQFTVIADGYVVFEPGVHTFSPVMRGGDAPRFTKIPISGVRELVLVVTNGGENGADYDHANWANPTIYCG